MDVKARAEQWFVSVLENIKDPLEAMINAGQSINERFHPNLKVRACQHYQKINIKKEATYYFPNMKRLQYKFYAPSQRIYVFN